MQQSIRAGEFSPACAVCLFIRERNGAETRVKNLKRAAAIAGAVLLLLVFSLPMIFAFGDDEGSQSAFRGALAAAIMVPVMAYIFLLGFRFFGKKKPQEETKHVIENIVFDVGKVLVGYDWETYLKGFGFSEEKYEKIAKAVFKSKVWDERDRGLYEEDEYLRQFCAAVPEYEKDIREVMRRSPETIQPYDYADTWVKYLKNQGYHLYILSNYSQFMLEHTKEKLSFLKYMDGIVFSCQVKELKPEPGIYQKLLEQYHLDPKKTVFLDDREENCKGAEDLGIHAICFKDLKQAAAELEKLEVK